MVRHMQPIFINLKTLTRSKLLMNYEEKMIPIYQHEVYIDKIKTKIIKVNTLKHYILNEDWNNALEILNKDIEKLNDKQDETKKQARKIIQQVQPNYMSKTIDD